jgi:hypothetical protein
LSPSPSPLTVVLFVAEDVPLDISFRASPDN